jgi:hypothetical protein
MPIKRPPKPEPMVLRQSMINLFLACPKAFELTYLQKKASLTVPPLVEGSSMHAVLEANNRHKAKTEEDMKSEDLVTLWDDTWSDKKKEITDWSDESPDTIQERGRGLIKHYRQHVAHGISPLDEDSIEMPVEGMVGTVKMTGIIDLVAAEQDPLSGVTNPRILDYKTVKQKRTVADAENDIQLGVYPILSGVMQVGYVSLIKTKEPKVETVKVDRTPESLQRTVNVVESVAASIKTGVFPYTDPSNWKCSQRYCGVFWACKQGGGSG